MKIRKLTAEDVTFEIHIEEEGCAVNFATGDAKFDKELEDSISQRLDRGDTWAWCVVVVVARWESWIGEDTVGCCSYDSEEDFKKDSTFEDMKLEALACLNQTTEIAAESLSKLEV